MSDIRKIQTGNNQYTLHARVSDRLAVSDQIGSPTKPVFVDANGNIQACSRDIPAVDTAMSATSTNPVQNKAVFDALKLKADAAALDKYQPKYNADYVAASDFDYSELPNDITTIDLNGYTMNVSVDNTIVQGHCYNGSIYVTGNQVTLGGSCNNVSIYSEDTAFCKNGEGVIFTNCNLVQITIDYDCECENSYISSCVIKSFFVIKSSLLNWCTFDVPNYDDISIVNSVIDDVLYNKCAIKNNKFIETGYESNIISPSVSGNAPSCEAVKDALQLKADKTQLNDLATKTELNSKADASALNNYVTTATANTTYAKKSDITNVYKFKGTKNTYNDLPKTDKVTGDVWNITTADANYGIKAGDNVAWNGTEWDNLSGTVDLSNYLQKGGSQTTTSTADGGSNIYTFKDGSTITVKNGSKGSTGAAATWFSGDAVTGTSTTAKTFPVSGSKAGDMYLNTGTNNVYKATAANQWVYLCNIKGSQGTPGNNGTTPTIKAAAGGNIGAVGTPSVTANTSGTTTTFTFNNLKGQKGDTGATVTWHTGTAVTGTAATVAGAKTGDMYLNTKTYNVYKSTGTNKWIGVCNIKGANGTTPTIKAAAGGNINSVGTPTVSATTNGAITTFTFNNLKGQKGETGATITWHSGTAVPNAGVHAVTNAKVGDMYLNTHTCDVFKAANAVQASFNWVLVCNIKGAKGDAADIPKLAKGVAGIVPGTINDNLSASRWLNGGDNGTGAWRSLPTAGGGTSGMVRTCKDYTGSINRDDIHGYGHGTTPPTLQPITSGASDYRGVESDGSGRLFVNVPAYEKNISRAQNTVLAAPTTGTGTATFRKLATSDIPWNEKFKVMTPAQYKTATKLTNVFYFILEE